MRLFVIDDARARFSADRRAEFAKRLAPTPRLWRYKDIPAIVYGPSPTGMGSVDEHVTVDEFFTS